MITNRDYRAYLRFRDIEELEIMGETVSLEELKHRRLEEILKWKKYNWKDRLEIKRIILNLKKELMIHNIVDNEGTFIW